VELPDGTRAQLNAATRLHTDFRRGQRVVRLEQGEAYFSVVKDAAHPFRVETAGGTVTVLGTQFNVRLLPGGAVEVTLFEGGVDFERAQTHVRLSPGQQISESGPARVLSEGELAAVAAWRDGRIRLNGLTLAGAAARFATFHGKQIAVAPDAASIEMGGSYSLDDLAGFFDTLSGEALGLRVVRIDADHYTIARK
jgi:transmembrane sensor